MGEDLYVRVYIGHRGKFGHEFLEIEFRPDGKVSSDHNSFSAWLFESSVLIFFHFSASQVNMILDANSYDSIYAAAVRKQLKLQEWHHD